MNRGATVGLMFLLAGPLWAQKDSAEIEHFEMRVRPLLINQCLKCHGEEKSKGGLRLDSREGLLRGGNSGPAAKSGQPDQSLLLQAVRQVGELKMPPEGKLKGQEVADLTTWIKNGAPFPSGPMKTLKPLPLARAADLLPNSAELAPLLEGWYQASSIKSEEGNAVANWPDSSGKGKNLSAPSNQGPLFVAKSKVNARPAVRFDGNAKLTGFSTVGPPVSPGSIFLVVHLEGNLGKPGGQLLAWMQPSGKESSKFFVDGVLSSPILENPLLWQGGVRGELAEILLFNKALSESERVGIEAYLARKYALVLPGSLRDTAGSFSKAEKEFWSFQPVKDRPLPAVRDASWAKTPIDRFILARLEEKNLKPSPAADRRTLVRRVYFDLTGLPATPDEIEKALQDKSPRWLESVVEGLLQSPHYGERWGRHWLDVVRYAETTANDANAVMRFAHRYRDYVVHSFNQDKPYGQFIVEQLAGDLLPDTTDISLKASRIIATGFLMLGPKALAETDKEQTRLDIVDEQIDVTTRAFLGLTVSCARCHDHKFDPVPTADYYGLAGIFRGTEPLMDENRNATMFQEWPLFQIAGEKPFLVMAPREGLPVNLQVHLRGNRFQLGALAPRRLPQILAGPEAPVLSSQSGRLELAQWIASKGNPLTARVMVNRVWQHHFGTGLVATSDNFGKRGESPSHAELLDWLASRFLESGGSVKALHRLILSSSVYQQATRSNAAGETADPENRLLWRMNRRRLEAEILRDAMLAVSGKLDRTIGGNDSGEFLYREAEIQDPKRGFAPNKVKGDHPFYNASLRRSLYLPVVRNMLPDVITVWDGADPYAVTAVRTETTVPSQALFLLNNPLVREQALQFGKLLLSEGKPDDTDRLRRACLRALGREPVAEETAQGLTFLKAYAAEAERLKTPGDRLAAAWQSFCQMLFCSNEFLYVE
ncbi:MAG: DUF1553 domain-containing protein [Gemmataceae bacterium]|nr:DUF1553 domain-containing protein [Gemmataceae bacterium]